MEEQVTTTETTQNTNSAQTENKNVLFGSIGYNDDIAYENFIQNMNLNQAIFILVASANYSQSRGILNLIESETLATAIRTIRKNSASEQTVTNQTEETH